MEKLESLLREREQLRHEIRDLEKLIAEERQNIMLRKHAAAEDEDG